MAHMRIRKLRSIFLVLLSHFFTVCLIIEATTNIYQE